MKNKSSSSETGVSEERAKRLAVLCPQLYEGLDMKVTGCSRCHNWEDNRCTVLTGCEHLPLVPPKYVPDCPIQDRCQHQLQAGDGLCAVRARGMICESALEYAGDPEPANHPLGFHASTIITPEELEEEPWRGFTTID